MIIKIEYHQDKLTKALIRQELMRGEKILIWSGEWADRPECLSFGNPKVSLRLKAGKKRRLIPGRLECESYRDVYTIYFAPSKKVIFSKSQMFSGIKVCLDRFDAASQFSKDNEGSLIMDLSVIAGLSFGDKL